MAADLSFTNAPADVVNWVWEAEEGCRNRDYAVERAHHPDAVTLYVEMNSFEVNPDRWFVDAFACGPPVAPEDPVVIGPAFDSIVGAFLGDVRIDSLTLTGMEPLQAAFETHFLGEDHDGTEDLASSFVRYAFFDVFARATVIRAPLLRLAAAVHDDDVFAVWDGSTIA